MKKCSVCKEEKLFSDFHKSKSTKDGYGYRCRICDREAREDYRKRNEERFRKIARTKQIKLKFGITDETYNLMLEKQKGCCAICGTTNPSGEGSTNSYLKHMAIDHCHKSTKIRGLLCNCCNRALGLFRDDVNLLNNAINYLNNALT